MEAQHGSSYPLPAVADIMSESSNPSSLGFTILDSTSPSSTSRSQSSQIAISIPSTSPGRSILAEKPYHTKRPHKKSRTGCHNCKARKVKCDEARPSCRSCTLRRVNCIYTSPPAREDNSHSVVIRSRSPLRTDRNECIVFSTNTDPVSPSSSNQNSNENSSDNNLPSFQVSHNEPVTLSLPPLDERGYPIRYSPTGLPLVPPPPYRPFTQPVDELDMKLLWWYTTETYSSFSVDGGRDRDIENALKVSIVQLAFQNPFLMNSILGMTCLHLQASLDSSDSQLPPVNISAADSSGGAKMTTIHMRGISPLRALGYRVRALEGYRAAVEAADPSTFSALLACSLLLCALSSQAFREPEPEPIKYLENKHNSANTINTVMGSKHPRLYILDWIVVWRGIGVIVDLAKPSGLLRSGLSKLFFRPKIDLDATPEHIPNRLLFFINSLSLSDPENAHKNTYYTALRYLGSIYQELRLCGFSPILDLRIITYFTFVPQAYVDLARTRRPVALVVLAHWLAFADLVQGVWWMGGIAGCQLKEVRDQLLHGEKDFQGKSIVEWIAPPLASLNCNDPVERARCVLEDPLWTPPVRGQGGMGDDDAQLRVQSLSWVNDRGREVALESGEVICEHTSGTQCDCTTPFPDVALKTLTTCEKRSSFSSSLSQLSLFSWKE